MLLQPPKPKTTNVEAAKRKTPNFDICTDFTAEEIDRLISPSAIEQEIHKMHHKGLAPSQRRLLVTADVTDAVRWQQKKEKELEDLRTKDTDKSKTWVQDLLEDFIAFGLSPSNTASEAKLLLENLDADLKVLESGGFGPDARNFITSLRKELELVIENIEGIAN